MKIWEIMTEDAQKQIKDMWEGCYDFDEVLEERGLTREAEDFSEYLDEYNCFIYGDFVCKTENGKIIKVYYIYEINATAGFGDNKELLLISGHEKVAVINRNTLDEVVSAWTR